MTQIINDRRALHAIPELEWNLPKTSEYIKKVLEGLNCRVFSPVDTAVCAFFDFGADHAIGFRADMDALPIQEKTGVEFTATEENGVIHVHALGVSAHAASPETGKNAQTAMLGMLADLPLEDPAAYTDLVCKLMN